MPDQLFGHLIAVCLCAACLLLECALHHMQSPQHLLCGSMHGIKGPRSALLMHHDVQAMRFGNDAEAVLKAIDIGFERSPRPRDDVYKTCMKTLEMVSGLPACAATAAA